MRLRETFNLLFLDVLVTNTHPHVPYTHKVYCLNKKKNKLKNLKKNQEVEIKVRFCSH